MSSNPYGEPLKEGVVPKVDPEVLLKKKKKDPVFGNGVLPHADYMESEMSSCSNSQTFENKLPPPPAYEKIYPSSFHGRTRFTAYRSNLTLQGKIYNFLERPTGWKCFIYHFT